MTSVHTVVKMKILPKAFLASVFVVLLLLPLVAESDQLPVPLEKTLLPGVTTLNYWGQTLRFTTDVPIRVSLLAIGEGRIRLQFSRYGSLEGGASGTSDVLIQWENWDNEIYSGPAPDDPWSGILNTESGFTEK